MLAGLLAGVLAFAFARLIGEPSINQAIAFESYVEYTLHHEQPGMEVVSRPLQSTAGLATGTLIFGVGMGGIFALVFSAAYGRMSALRARGTAALLGCLGFVAVFLAPFLKYPANPPAIGDPVTLRARTFLYLVMIALSVTAMVLAVSLRQPLATRFGAWNATLAVAAGYLVLVAICWLAMPGVNEVPQVAVPGVVGQVTGDGVSFPATVLWDFRVASVGLQAVIWASLSLTFGPMAERLLEGQAEASRARETRRERCLADLATGPG